ncbi:MAG TPA: hypothetical protein VG267_12760 [Terracidiphilus sp.]|jgi:hypothetical protein|nr:hypothetical protein [Terracidiphilus sp.]
MPNQLDGARLKVIRAQEHIDSLKDEIAVYLNARPWVIGTQQYDDAAVPAPIITVPPPLRLSTIVGDCVTNIRAALDYIVWELAQRYFSPAFNQTSGNDRRITSFPIAGAPGEPGYVDRLDRLTKRGIPTSAIDEIKVVQPHNRGYESLLLLHKLVNTDKHRMPILTLAYVPFFAFSVDGAGRVQPIAHWGPDRKTIPTPAELEAMHMEHRASVTVTFQDKTMPREPVDRTLEDIIKTIADIIPRFEQFFA